VSSYNWETEAQQAYDAIEALDEKTCDNVFRLVQKYTSMAVASAAAAVAIGAEPGAGGPTSLTDLTDVTGTPGIGKAPVDDGSGVYPLTKVTTTEDLDDVLASVAAVDWHTVGQPGEPAFMSGWRNTGDPWGNCRYRLTLNNIVHLEGTVSNDDASLAGATWVPIFQFPPECNPGASLRFTGVANDKAIAMLIVWADGTLVFGGWITGPQQQIDYVSLAQVSFSVGG